MRTLITLTAICAVLIISSCSREKFYTCRCVSADGANGVEEEVKAESKKEAQSLCTQYGTKSLHGVSLACSLK